MRLEFSSVFSSLFGGSKVEQNASIIPYGFFLCCDLRIHMKSDDSIQEKMSTNKHYLYFTDYVPQIAQLCYWIGNHLGYRQGITS